MNAYEELKNKCQKEVNEFPFGFAYGDKQFEDMMIKWGLDASKDSDLAQVVHLFSGAYLLKKDIPAYEEMYSRHADELEKAIAADKTGDGFIFDMFLYELANHEYGYTHDFEYTLEMLGYTAEDIKGDKRLAHGLEKAAREIIRREE